MNAMCGDGLPTWCVATPWEADSILFDRMYLDLVATFGTRQGQFHGFALRAGNAQCAPAEEPRTEARRQSWVYFARRIDGGPIKIGMTTRLSERIGALQTSSPVEIRIVAKVEGGAAEERVWHRRFAHLRCKGEWFEPGPELIMAINELSELQ